MSRFFSFIFFLAILIVLFYGGFLLKEKTPAETGGAHIYLYQKAKLIPVPRKLSGQNNSIALALSELWKGPSAMEAKNNIISLIPGDVLILSMQHSGEILSLNFNDRILKLSGGNAYIEGILKQIVFTATQFPEIKAVQFAVEGKQNQALIIGGDGYTISAPLTRNSFKEQ